MKVTAYLYPNPAFDGATLTNIWGEEYVMRNEPFLELVFCGLVSGEYAVEVLNPIRLRQSFKISSQNESVFLFHPEFADPYISEVSIRAGTEKETLKEMTLPISVHKITGQVKDFDGCPFPAYLWACEYDPDRPQTIVRTDSEGRFTLWYPEGRKARIFVDDESYSRTTFECWITVETLKGDIEINPRVGNFELWELHAWHTQLAWQIYFWPCSLPLDLRSKKSGWKLPHFPRLAKENIVVRINGKETPVKGLHVVRVWAGEGREYPAHLLELPFQEHDYCGPTFVQVEVQTKARGRGEAWYVVW